MLQSNAAVFSKREGILIGGFYYENIELTFFSFENQKIQMKIFRLIF